MDQNTLDQALLHVKTTKDVLIGQQVLNQVPELFRQRFGQRAAVIVADENTYAAAGAQTRENMEVAGIKMYDPMVFPGKPTLHAEYSHVLEVEEFLKALDAVPIAVGSGTVNDLTKLASHRLGRKYMVIGTATSMDGYTAFGASITKEGFKNTIICNAPVSVVADLDVLADAPPEMNAWGYGDLIGKIVSGADWILADAVGADPIKLLPWDMVQEPLRAAVADPHLLKQGNPDALFKVFGGLVLTGLAIQVAEASRPASGSEHLFSHLWEMQGTRTPQGGEVSHGSKVSIGTIASAAFYERLLALDMQDMDVEKALEQWPSFDEIQQEIKEALNVPQIIEEAAAQCRQKYLPKKQLAERLHLIKSVWPKTRTGLEAQLYSADQLQQMIKAAGGVSTPQEIGVDLDRLKESYRLAGMIRSRYTIFDLTKETGYRQQLVDELFESDGFWG